MSPDEVRNELALAALAGRWSVELTDAVADVAVNASTDPSACVMANDWVRTGTAEVDWDRGTDVDEWITIRVWLAWLNDEELEAATVDSLLASFNAVMDFLGRGPHRSMRPRSSLDEPF